MNGRKMMIATVLAAMPGVSFANMALENAAFLSGPAMTENNPERARDLAFKALEGGFRTPEAEAVEAGGNSARNAKSAVTLGAQIADRMRVTGEAPPAPAAVSPVSKGIGAFLKDDSGSIRGTDAAILLVVLFLGALVVPAAIGFIVANGAALTFGAVPATAKILGYAGAVVGAKLGLDWFKKK